MPRYRFEVLSVHGPAAQLDARDLPDDAGAHAEAQRLAAILLDEARMVGHLVDLDILRVSDEAGHPVLGERLQDLVRVNE